MQTISVKQLADKQRQTDVDLIDVRMPTEYREVHADGAVNFPLDSLDPKAIVDSVGASADKPVYVICKSGNRSSKATQQFLNAGIENVVNVDGGTTAWVEAGLPAVHGKKSVSLERQVRIVAGFLALLGRGAELHSPLLRWDFRLRRCGVDVRWYQRHLHHGHVALEDALEPMRGFGVMFGLAILFRLHRRFRAGSDWRRRRRLRGSIVGLRTGCCAARSGGHFARVCRWYCPIWSRASTRSRRGGAANWAVVRGGWNVWSTGWFVSLDAYPRTHPAIDVRCFDAGRGTANVGQDEESRFGEWRLQHRVGSGPRSKCMSER